MPNNPRTEKELIELAKDETPLDEYEIVISVRARSAEDVEDWFCRTVMGETGICEVETWCVY